MGTTSYAIALGSNRYGRHGAPAATLSAAISALGAAGLIVFARSATRATPPLGPAARSFANAAVLVRADLDPPALLATLKSIERAFGRRAGRRWGARILDLDILLWSGGNWSAPSLIVPHAAIATRDFVLQPLAEIAPCWRLPRGGTVDQARARLRRDKPVAKALWVP